MLEIGFVVGAGCEQGDVRRSACRAAGLDAIDQGAVSLRQPLHRERLKSLREQARDDLPVFEQVTQT